MSTPTMQDVADLEARVEELESMLGILDGEDGGESLEHAIKRRIQDSERRRLRRGRGRGQLACLNPSEDVDEPALDAAVRTYLYYEGEL